MTLKALWATTCLVLLNIMGCTKLSQTMNRMALNARFEETCVQNMSERVHAHDMTAYCLCAKKVFDKISGKQVLVVQGLEGPDTYMAEVLPWLRSPDGQAATAKCVKE